MIQLYAGTAKTIECAALEGGVRQRAAAENIYRLEIVPGNLWPRSHLRKPETKTKIVRLEEVSTAPP
jgi:hypothetical protein